MKKTVLLLLAGTCLFFSSNAQDIGYRTTDAGLEYIWADNNPTYNLQVATNAKIHHSFIASLGIKTVMKPIAGSPYFEQGNGWGGSLGYRYYFSYMPKGFFLGARAHLWSLKLHHTADPGKPSEKVSVAQPSAEIGYTVLINDLVFITAYYSAGQQFKMGSSGNSFSYGSGTVSAAGISAGFRF